MKHLYKVLVVFFLTFYFYHNIFAQQPSPLDVGIDEKLGATLPMDLQLVNDTGDTVKLGDMIDRPVILTFVYFRCPNLCSTILTGQADVMNRSSLIPGVDYKALTVSFNHNETWELGRDKKKNYLKLFDHPFPPDAWQFLTADSLTIAQLTASVGFKFKKVNDEFAHTGALIIISPEGKVIRYLYGTDYLKFDFKMAITEALAERPGPSITKVIAYCFSYDSNSRSYNFNITRVIGTVILFFLLLFILFLVVKKIRS